MKLSFSTLGCPKWSWSEILSAASDLGYDGIELRGLNNEMYMPGSDYFSDDKINSTVDRMKRLGLEIPCITSDCNLFLSDRDYVSETKEYIDLAKKTGAKYIRVLGDKAPEPGTGVNEELVKARLAELAPYAEEAGIGLLVESNGIYADTKKLRKLLDEIASPAVAALWDINHPFRYFGESPEETYKNIGKYIKHIHVKDSRIENGKTVYKMLGYGDLPIKEAVSVLKNNGYDGYISLEWTKRWNEELEDAGIVFSHFIYAAKKMIR